MLMNPPEMPSADTVKSETKYSYEEWSLLTPDRTPKLEHVNIIRQAKCSTSGHSGTCLKEKEVHHRCQRAMTDGINAIYFISVNQLSNPTFGYLVQKQSVHHMTPFDYQHNIKLRQHFFFSSRINIPSEGRHTSPTKVNLFTILTSSDPHPATPDYTIPI